MNSVEDRFQNISLELYHEAIRVDEYRKADGAAAVWASIASFFSDPAENVRRIAQDITNIRKRTSNADIDTDVFDMVQIGGPLGRIICSALKKANYPFNKDQAKYMN